MYQQKSGSTSQKRRKKGRRTMNHANGSGPTPEQLAAKLALDQRQAEGHRILGKLAVSSGIKDPTVIDICVLLLLRVSALEKEIAALKGDRPLIVMPNG